MALVCPSCGPAALMTYDVPYGEPVERKTFCANCRACLAVEPLATNGMEGGTTSMEGEKRWFKVVGVTRSVETFFVQARDESEAWDLAYNGVEHVSSIIESVDKDTVCEVPASVAEAALMKKKED